ncbi:hypothetical protein [Amycolatopsis vastitatis]|uniref:Uncharacterized protein n=1 Tax=Amycolatopsis vastitatis TaxID=1905142 RepID=A0A229SWP1_9PSEU|nr:hypothetical protein [Amycolatopsis vastitatis]OXM63091.1 hypothetical protein CF165_32550 [Amycolatopsis vastitatis]
MDKPDLTEATTYVVAGQSGAVDRWHVLPDMTVIYERRPGEFEEARVLTASTLRDRPSWVEVSAGQADDGRLGRL